MAVWFLRPTKSSPVATWPESSIELRIQPLTGGLMVMWNSALPEISTARVGLVTIQDGAYRQEFPLDKEQLMAGQFFYPPISAMVRFTFQVFNDKGVQQHSTTAILPSASEESHPGADWSKSPVPLLSATPLSASEVPPTTTRTRIAIAKPQGSKLATLKAALIVELAQRARQDALRAPLADRTEMAEPPAFTSPVSQMDSTGLERLHITAPPPAQRADASSERQVPPTPAEAAAIPARVAEPPSATATERPTESPGSGASVPAQPIQQTQAVVPHEIVVEVNLSIDRDGSIIRAEASPGEGSLYWSLARFAVANARLWKFRPAREGNRSVPGQVLIHFRFNPRP